MRKDELAMRKPASVAGAARTTPYWPWFGCRAGAPADAREESRSRKAELMGLGRGDGEERGKGRG